MLRSLRNLGRIVVIALTLARHDALFWLTPLPGGTLLQRLARILTLGRRAGGPAGRPGQRVAAALQALGPSFIKLGQALATRADLVGEEAAADLAQLQDRLAPFPGAVARATVERELGQTLGELYRSFEAEPVAAASIAQVHFAVATDGRDVAVKVLRPGIEQAFARDLDLFGWLAEWAERAAPHLRRLKPVAVVKTLADSVTLEMDLRFEAAAASELAQNFRGDPDYRVPAVDWPRTARRVLTIERIQGIRIDDRAAILAAGHDPQAVLAKAANAFFRQVFRDGFFHADMHPGNLFVAPDGALVAVDFGIMGRLDRRTRYYLADMLMGFLQGDYRRVAAVHFEAGYVRDDQSLDAFALACRSIGEPILGRPLHEISLARLLAQLFQITETFAMETQPQLLLLQKTMLVAEGVGRQLDQSINMWELARPLIEAWVRDNRGPEAQIRQGVGDLAAIARRLPDLIADAEKAAATIAGGGLRLHPDTLSALGAGAGNRPALWPIWVALAILAIAVAVALR
jgi:ubiquinone biosynthesis protein